MKALDPFSFPFDGHSLIEASAGTGKTYTIVNLYLRLILGHGTVPLSAEQILVVTFTNAATAELKQRIFERLQQMHNGLQRGSSDDGFIQRLLTEITHHEEAKTRLFLAQKQMDIAPILTIHGFCHRLLKSYSLESGIEFGRQLVLDETPLLQQAVEDYWRLRISQLPQAALEMVLSIWPSPEALQSQLMGFIHRQFSLIDGQNIGDLSEVLASLDDYVSLIEQAKQWWIKHGVSEQLKEADLKANAKLAKAPTLQAMNDFVHSKERVLKLGKDSWTIFGSQAVAKARKKSSKDLSHLDFTLFDRLSSLQKSCQNQVYQGLFLDSLHFVRQRIQQQKDERQILSGDDLLTIANQAVKGSVALRDVIANLYPFALVDEFQDTDPIQFSLFQTLYQQSQVNGNLIMIGDPKQAIYSFRGADIFTYLSAKRQIEEQRHYALDTNWRSTQSLINATNQLFEQSPNGFLFEQEIPFYSVKGSGKQDLLYHNGQAITPLQFDVYRHDVESDKPMSWSEGQKIMSENAATQVAALLNQSHFIGTEKLMAGDICLLVRDRLEAELLKKSLAKQGIYSAYQARVSVFATSTAQDLFVVLKSLAQPRSESLFKAALLTELMGVTGEQLSRLLDDDVQWQSLLNLLVEAQQKWVKHGVMVALNGLFSHLAVFTHLAAHYEDGIRRITDVRHLTELLQETNNTLTSQSDVLDWYEHQLASPDHQVASQQLRLESAENLVQIVTLHSSKGLQYPVVFMPFACRSRSVQENLFHNEQGELVLEFDSSNFERAEYERLAEVIRLFYVGITRAMYFCSIGIWNPMFGKQRLTSGFSQSAIGHLLLGNQLFSWDALNEKLASLAALNDIQINPINPQQKVIGYEVQAEPKKTLEPKAFSRPFLKWWKITSYSAISQTRHHHYDQQIFVAPEPGFDESRDNDVVLSTELATTLNRYAFPRGANAGSFLHDVLEHVDFQSGQNLHDVIEQFSPRYGIDAIWHPILETWMLDILATPIAPDLHSELRLSALEQQAKIAEMAFYLPLKNVSCIGLNKILNDAYPDYHFDYQFHQIEGLLKGFIDLVFQWGDKFYVADYKSNHLGDTEQDYAEQALEGSMVHHDYILQGILYTLALHRYLRLNLHDYEYTRHIGGAFYLFLRGMSKQSPQQGVFRFLPSQELIQQLDVFFNGEQP